MKLTILGCYAATPRTFTNPTSQVLEIRNRIFLIDCGEGTQVQLRKNKIRFSKINHIFISHLHGDHFFGLIGLISTFALLNRTTDLHIYGPKGIQEIINLQLTKKEDVYLSDMSKIRKLPYYGLKSGPNITFFKSIELCNKHNTTLFLETDCILHDNWLKKI
jgi:ribonuclease BN (tRNA processing enzyme)